MPTSKFYLKPANKKNGLSPVMFLYHDRGLKFKYYTKVQTDKQYWTGNRIFGKSLEILDANKKLEDIERAMSEIEREALINQTQFDIETVKKKFKVKLGSKSGDSLFYELYDQFIEESRSTKAASTTRQYIGTKTRLKEFERVKRVKISFETINNRLYDSFLSFLIDDKKLLNNSIGKHIKTFKTFGNYILRNELTYQKFNLTSFKVLKEDIDIIHLTDDELFKIYNLPDLPQNYEYVRDYFCFECFTGLRFSDIAKIHNDNVKGDFLVFKTTKTKETLYVPLNQYAKEILNKYKGRFLNRPLPPTLTNQKSNQYLKDIAEMAGLDEMIILEKFSGSRRIETTKLKCDLITTHTGRRTFITLSHEKGMAVEMIMKITGIKKWETLKKYLKVSEKSKLIQMNQIWNKKVI